MNTEKVKEITTCQFGQPNFEGSGLAYAEDPVMDDHVFNDGMDSLFLEIEEPLLDVFDDGMEDLFSKVNDPSTNEFVDDGLDDLFTNLDEPNQDYKETPIPVNSTKQQKRSSHIPSFFLSPNQESQPVLKPYFPGPAGMLDNNHQNPYLYSTGSLPVYETRPGIKKSIIKPISTLMKPTVCSKQKRRTSIIENEGSCILQQQNKPWLTMMKEINTSLTDPDSILHLMNIGWIKNNADHFPDKVKVPFLMGVVEESLSKNLNVRNSTKLTDHTGTIFVLLDNTFLAAFKDHVNPGTCLVLLNCRIHYEKAKNCICLVVLEKNVCFLATLKESLEPVLVSDAKNHGLMPGNSNDYSSDAKNEVFVMQTEQWNPDHIMNDYMLLQSHINKDKSNAAREAAPSVIDKDKQLVNNDDDDQDFVNAINDINFECFD